MLNFILTHASAFYAALTLITIWNVYRINRLTLFASMCTVQWFFVIVTIDFYFTDMPYVFMRGLQIASLSFTVTYVALVYTLGLRFFTPFIFSGLGLFAVTVAADLGSWSDYAFRTGVNVAYLSHLLFLYTRSKNYREALDHG